ncbi:MAG: hypothetical protein ABSB22_21360 [Thermodesulfobacteriota bacterium]|jgi:hypothetical protein
MKESYDEGIASYIGPESCAGARESSGEALTGVCAGRVLSPGMVLDFRVPTSWTWRKATRCTSITREVHGACAVVDPGHTRKHLARESGDPMAASVRKGTEAASGSPRTQADDERSWEVGQFHSTEEVFEQSPSKDHGEDGGKGVGQGEDA